VYKYKFTIERDGEEIELEAEFHIEPYVPGNTSGLPEDCFPPSGGCASISDDIFFADTNDRFSGGLYDNERDKIESEAYSSWERYAEDDCEPESEAFPPNNYPAMLANEHDSLDCLADDLDDLFHDERAFHLSGRGEVF
jgi:hypothetical protein